jgi:hypothetical protein
MHRSRDAAAIPPVYGETAFRDDFAANGLAANLRIALKRGPHANAAAQGSTQETVHHNAPFKFNQGD